MLLRGALISPLCRSRQRRALGQWAAAVKYETLLVEDAGDGVARVVLNRPSKANAMNVAMWRSVPAVWTFGNVARERTISCVMCLLGICESAFKAPDKIPRVGSSSLRATASTFVQVSTF